MCSPGDSETSCTGKFMASLTICHSTSSGTSGVANGLTTRKQTSVNGSARNSSSSSGERRAISAGMYSPPSGASPRSTAPRNEVSGAFPPVLRYRIRNRFPFLEATPKTPPPSAAIRAAQPLLASPGQSRDNSAAAPQSDGDSNAPPSPAESLPPWSETHRATAQASDRSNIFPLTIVAPHPRPQGTPRSSIFAGGATNGSRCRSRSRSYPAPEIPYDFFPAHSKSHPASQSLPPGTALPFPHRSANPASPSTPPLH